MAPSNKDLRTLYQKSGNRCAFPGCRRTLTHFEEASGYHVNLSEVAHIVAQSPGGPRGDYPLSLEKRDLYENLILLCEEHHHVVDDQRYLYTVERLRQIKADHEAMIDGAAGRAVDARAGSGGGLRLVRETLHSTLLPVLKMPRYVYGVPCDYDDSQEREVGKEVESPRGDEMCPFIIRGGSLYCFQNLRYAGGPFRRLVGDHNKVERFLTREWWDDPDTMAWFVSLLNRSLNKLTGRKGLNLDRRHRRYYFQPGEPGKGLTVTYRPMNQASAERQVVWQPVSKRTGEARPYWYHKAVSLNFRRASEDGWCMSIRPEMHVTKDGRSPLDSEKIGSRVTHKKSRMFNYDLLGEVHFWRDFLGGSQPRIVLSFGERQNVVISTTLMQTEIEWPGVPEEHARPFKNVEYEENLFSLDDLSHLGDGGWEDEEGWEEEELEDGL